MVRINSYGGIVGWVFHKYFSGMIMGPYLSLLQFLRKKRTYRYTRWFASLDRPPLFEMVEIETINRCNGICSFCPANKYVDKRPLKKMSEGLFEKIVQELSDIDFSGDVLFEVNNEPLLDTRLEEFAAIVKAKVPNCRTQIITNGSLLTIEKMDSLSRVIDRIIINNYSTTYRLNKNILEIYKHIKNNKQYYENNEVEIRRRNVKEILTNRAGSAPNSSKPSCNVTMPCLYPFVGITIFPEGDVGLCSNDCFETTSFGNINSESLMDVWNGEGMRNVRSMLARGRKNYDFCKNCDVIGIGTRERIAVMEETNAK